MEDKWKWKTINRKTINRKAINRKKAVTSSIIISAFALTACGSSGNASVVRETESVQGQVQEAAQSSTATAEIISSSEEAFTDRDKEVGYDESSSISVLLKGDTIECSSQLVEIQGNNAVITGEGTYILSGVLEDGMITVDAEKTDKIQLVLNGVNINSSNCASLYIKQADKVFVTLAAGTENVLTHTGEYMAADDNNVDGTVFSKEDLTLNGEGSLSILDDTGNGIVSKDDLVITSGTYDIQVAGHGLEGKDCVKIAEGTFTIASGKDGIHGENTEDTTLGYVYIAGGTFHITSQMDGLDASGSLQADGGDFILTTGGGSQNASLKEDGSRNSAWGKWGQETQTNTAETDTASAKGIKADGDLILNNGVFTIDSSDDAIHSNSNVSIYDGEIEIASGDDGIHGDALTGIYGGSLLITKSYEGIEGQNVLIAGGEISLVSADDGLNAAGGNDASGISGRPGMDNFQSDAGGSIEITGGTCYINASGDGVDSNGSLLVSGGIVYVSGPSESGNGALDYDGEAQITGGIFVAAGSAGMAQNFTSASGQGCMLVNVGNQAAGSSIMLTDSAGNQLIGFTPENSYSCAVISCPDIQTGNTYTVEAGTSLVQVEMDSLVVNSGTAGAGAGREGSAAGRGGGASIGSHPAFVP